MTTGLTNDLVLEVEGQQYRLVLDLNALCRLEDAYDLDTPAILDRIERGSMRFLRMFVWASLHEYHRELPKEFASTIVRHNGGLIGFKNKHLPTLLATMTADPEDLAALQAAQPPGEPPRPQPARRASPRGTTGVASTLKRAVPA